MLSLLLFCLVHVYGDMGCYHCRGAVNFLSSCKVKFAFHDIRNPTEITRLTLLMEEEGKEVKKIPQIFICDELIGGRSDMMALHKSGKLKEKLLSRGIKSSC